MKTIILTLAIFMTISLPCDSTNQKFELKVETVEDIKTITNPILPRNGKSILKLNDEIRIGETETGDAFIYKPSDIQVDYEGNIYILDRGLYCIKVFNSQGKYLRKFGRKGQGPGEFTWVSRFVLMPKNKIYLVDCNQRRILIFSTSGKPLKAIRYDPKRYVFDLRSDYKSRLYLSEKELILDNIELSEKLESFQAKRNIYSFEIMQQEWQLFKVFKGEVEISRGDGKGTGGFSSNRIPTIVWNINKHGKLVAGLNDTYLLAIYSSRGVLEFMFGRKFKSKRNKYYRGFSWQNKKLPAFGTKLLIDDDNRMWIELFTYGEEDKRIYDIFSKDGIFLKQFVSKLEILQIKNGRIYGRSHTSEGNIVIHSARIISEID